MTEQANLQIILVSGACCQPNLTKLDTVVEKVLQQALGELGLTVAVRKVSLSHLLAGPNGLSPQQHGQVMALFQQYNTSFTPAILINDQVRFAAQPPNIEELKAALQDVAASKV